MTTKSIIPKEIETAFQDRTKAGKAHAAEGGVVCGYFNTGMPVEVALATGHLPMGIMPLPDRPTPHADEWVNETFDPQDRLILDQLLSDELTFLRVVVAVSKAQADSHVYFSVREILRQGLGGRNPPVYSYALLGMQHEVVREYGRIELDELARRLRSNSGIEATPERLKAAIKTMNKVRAAWRKLDAARRKSLVSGSDAIKLMSASHFMPAEDYIKAMDGALKSLPKEPRKGPRFAVMSSTALGDMRLHDAIEAGGATVVGEGDFWGSASVTPDITPGNDPMQAIYEHYYTYVPNLSVYPASKRLKWFYETAVSPDVDGFIIHMPRSDRSLGWDYPRMRDFLYDNKKPHLMMREDSSNSKDAATITKKVADFVKTFQEKVA